ncbi:hypothetical protein KKC88_02975 [Patescibacteria group bacterium]|nr:hypothetical protein [Patescibacteria group bacterium]MBU1673460.1 hypothetical protein [Patescibacteria group bacterium]MBU1962918.1 hypothetical protein [Patescibacteria group bacterium]
MNRQKLTQYWARQYGQYKADLAELKKLLPHDLVLCTQGLVERVKQEILLHGILNDRDLFDDAALFLAALCHGQALEIEVQGMLVRDKLPPSCQDLVDQIVSYRELLMKHDSGAYFLINMILSELHPKNGPRGRTKPVVKHRTRPFVWVSCTTDFSTTMSKG